MHDNDIIMDNENVFQEAFKVFNSMRENNEGIDIVVRGDDDVPDNNNNGVACHKLVLSAMSPYFRAMFRKLSRHHKKSSIIIYLTNHIHLFYWAIHDS